MRHALTVVITVCCLCVLSFSQTADELIAKNIQARGGIEKIKAIKSVRMTGKFDGGGGFTAAVTQENERPDLVRETFIAAGHDAVQAYDGTTGWQIQPFGGKKDPELMGEDDLRDLSARRRLRRPAGRLQRERQHGGVSGPRRRRRR